MHRYIPILAKEAGFRRIGEKPVEHRARKYGRSKFGLERMLKGYLDLISVLFMSYFGRSPMYFFGSLGTLMFLIGGGVARRQNLEAGPRTAAEGGYRSAAFLFGDSGDYPRSPAVFGGIFGRAYQPRLLRQEQIFDR